MITRAFLHCPGIGPVKMKQLQEHGLHGWDDVLNNPGRIPFNGQTAADLIEEARRCRDALDNHDIHYFTRHFIPRDHWRILGRYFHKAAFFDIETTGLGYDDTITVIVCYHRGHIHYFTENENLEDFLDLLEQIDLLISFNGSTFDVPRVLDTFRIPELPCPHIDMRWLCYHIQYTGGLKLISEKMGFRRPPDLAGMDGMDAVDLWQHWLKQGDPQARSRVIRYCCADVLLLALVAIRALQKRGHDIESPREEQFWSLIPKI